MTELLDLELIADSKKGLFCTAIFLYSQEKCTYILYGM